MKPFPVTPETEALARRLIWFEPPAKALSDPIRLLAYTFANATPEDMRVIRAYRDDDDLREALDKAPPGIIDPRSWNYWNLRLGRDPVPPLPVRRLG